MSNRIGSFIPIKITSIISVLVVFFVQQNVCAQKADMDQSNVEVYKDNYSQNTGTKKSLNILKEIVSNETDPDEKLYYANELIQILNNDDFLNTLEKDSAYYYLSVGYLEKGNALQLKGEFYDALDSFFKCMESSKKEGDDELSAAILISIADTYSMIGNSESAEKYYDDGLQLLRKVNDSLSLASALLNAGDEYYKTEQYNKALENFNESGEIFEKLDFEIGRAYNLGNTGMVYAKQRNDQLAKSNINKAISILEEVEDFYPISVYLNTMSDIYIEQQNYDEALSYSHQSLNLAQKHQLKDQISEANLQLSKLMELSGNFEEALKRYKTHDIYQDSILNLENVQKMANLEVEKKDLEVENLEQKRKNQRIVIWSAVGVLFLTSLLAYGLFKRIKFVRATNKIIANEKERSDNLLLNILPEDTALELKEKGSVDAKKYPSVTVLFTDFKGFTKYAEGLSPEELVKTIDYYFTEFDLIMERHGLEKIKTIGDAYMAVGGLSLDNVDQAEDMIKAAKEMNDFVIKAKEDVHTSATFDIRIGINTGPVVAGVVGKKKFAYDIWGDTVNVAARMESSSEPGRINISEFTYNRVKSNFSCTYRGELEVKNRGKLKMYFVNT